jgi:hypothetical protein
MIRNRFTEVLYGATRVGALAAIAACADRAPMAPSLTPNDGPNLLLVGAGDATAVPGPGVATYPLYAGGGGDGPGTLVGEVRVTSAATATANVYNFQVTYDLTIGCLTETHLSIQLQASQVPQKNGNPTPGQFSQKGSHSCIDSYTYNQAVNLGPTDNAVVIAAHAVVKGGSGGSPGLPQQDYVSGSTLAATVTGFRPGTQSGFTAQNTPAVLAWEPFGAEPSVWDKVVGQDPNGAILQGAGADWVWRTERTAEPIQGEVVRMVASVNTAVARGGVFRITCDNGYRLELTNAAGTSVLTTGDGVNAGYGTQLSNAFHNAIATNTDLSQLGGGPAVNVSADGWQSVEAYNVNLTAGANTFTIYGVNEYMNTDDAHTGYPGPEAAGGRLADKDPVGDIVGNPAGCLFGLRANSTPGTPGTGSETAWGAPKSFDSTKGGLATILGGNFTGNNWATYFTYQVR